VIVIVGPTAAGKTELAIGLARALPGGGECVSADSMQVYRGMDLGTAKPTAEQRAAVPHHLLDLLDPAEEGFSVDVWLRLAEAVIAEVRGRGRWPIVVGGTNLYVKALLDGLLDGPGPDPALRARLAGEDPAALRARLERVDPAGAARIHPNDRKRTIRALEVHELTGRPLSARQVQWDRGAVRPDACLIGLEYPVEAINGRINARVRSMVAAGLVQEVRSLRLGRQAAEALGYRQILDHLAGRTTLDEAVEQIKIRTRRYAKQQRTWLRRFRAYPRATWIAAAELDTQQLVNTAVTAIMDDSADADNPSEGGGRGRGLSERLS